MAEAQNMKKLDVVKVFEAIAVILTRRGEGRVRLVDVKKVSEDVKKAG